MTRFFIRDFCRDWRRWSAAERICAGALCGLIATLITVSMIVGPYAY